MTDLSQTRLSQARILLHAPQPAALPAGLLPRLAMAGHLLKQGEAGTPGELAEMARDCAGQGRLDLAVHFIPGQGMTGDGATEGAAWEAGFLSAFRFARIILPWMSPRGRILFVQDDTAEPLPAHSLRIFARHAGDARRLGQLRLKACARSRAGEAIDGALQDALSPRPRQNALFAPLAALGRPLPQARRAVP